MNWGFEMSISDNYFKDYIISDLRDKSKSHSFTGGPFGSDLKQSDYTEQGVRIIQLQNIGDGSFIDKYRIYTSEKKADELISCNIYPGEIIISKMADPIGRACIIPDSEVRYLMSSDGIRLSVDESKFNTEYIVNLVNFSQTRRKIERLGTGSTRLRIGLRDLARIPVRIPKLQIQNKISNIISTWDNAISYKKDYIDELEKLYEAFLVEHFVYDKHTFNARIGEIIKEVRNTQHLSSEGKRDGKYPFFTNSTEAVNRFTDYYDFDGKYIIANTGGKAYFDYYEGKFSAMSDCYVFTTKRANVKYLYYLLKKNQKYIDYIGFSGSGLNHLDKKWFRKFRLNLPEQNIQDAVVKYLDSIRDTILLLDQEISELSKLKSGLMQQLFTGNIKIQTS